MLPKITEALWCLGCLFLEKVKGFNLKDCFSEGKKENGLDNDLTNLIQWVWARKDNVSQKDRNHKNQERYFREFPWIFSSVQFSHSVMSDSLRPHKLQHTRPPYPSPTPGVHTNPCPLSRWCHPTISYSVVPFSSCPQSLPASGYFQMSQFFTSGGQNIGVSASTLVLPMNTQDWSLGQTGWISLQSKRLSRVFSNTIVLKHQFFGVQLS